MLSAPDSTAPGTDWAQFLAMQALAPAPSAAGAIEGLQASRSCVMSDLSGYGLIEASGADAESFLHAQLSSDVRALGPERCQLATYNSPKGRVLATLLLWRSGDGFLLQVPAAVAASLAKRLSLFILRSKVRLTPAGDRLIRFGLTGAKAGEVLRQAGLAAPTADFGLVNRTAGANPMQPGALLRLPGERYELVADGADQAIALWRRLCEAGAAADGEAAWQWRAIRSGIADIVPETQDQFVPQMLNYDLLGGVSFTKGCYPGQEIVARTQYRGGIKRRTWLLHTDAEDPPVPAQPIHASGAAQAVGTVLCAAAAPDGGYDALACMHTELAEAAELRLGGEHGPALRRLALPYDLPAAR